MILQEIRSIVDLKEFNQLIFFVAQLKKIETEQSFILECYNLRLQFEKATDKELENAFSLITFFLIYSSSFTRFKRLKPWRIVLILLSVLLVL